MQKSRSPVAKPKAKSPAKKIEPTPVSSQQTASSSQPTKKTKSPKKDQEMYVEEEKKSSRSRSPKVVSRSKSLNSDRSKSPSSKFSKMSITINKKSGK